MTAARRLYELSGVPMVKAQVHSYRDAWLMAAALVWKTDLPAVAVELSDVASQAAFALADIAVDE